MEADPVMHSFPGMDSKKTPWNIATVRVVLTKY